MENDEPILPSLPDNAIIYRYGNAWDSCSIVVDPTAGMIHFHNCHLPRQFIAAAQVQFSCPISEVTGVYRGLSRGYREFLTICTATGKAIAISRPLARWTIGPVDANYLLLRDYLTKAVPVNRPEFATDDPQMIWICLGGSLAGVCGLLTVLSFFPSARTTVEMLLYVVLSFGVIFGALFSYLLVHFGSRWLGIDLARPFKYVWWGIFWAFMFLGLVGPSIPQTVGAVLGGIIVFAFAAMGLRKSLKARSLAERSGQIADK